MASEMEDDLFGDDVRTFSTLCRRLGSHSDGARCPTQLGACLVGCVKAVHFCWQRFEEGRPRVVSKGLNPFPDTFAWIMRESFETWRSLHLELRDTDRTQSRKLRSFSLNPRWLGWNWLGFWKS